MTNHLPKGSEVVMKTGYETSDYAAVEEERFGSRHGYRVKSRGMKGGSSWASDGVLFRSRKDAETVARLVAKARRCEEIGL